MSDKELLELAAKAAGWTIEENGHDVQGHPWFWCHQLQDYWDALTDDGDALRLAVKLGINIPTKWEHEKMERCGLNVYEATRRAIVRAAAEIGKGMK